MGSKIGLSAALALLGLVAAAPVAGHPLGNFTINRYAAIRVEPEAVEIRYLVDMAEIPTFQEMQEWNMTAEVDRPATVAYLVRQADVLGRGLRVDVDGRPLILSVRSRQVVFTPGAADLPTMKIAVVYRAPIEAMGTRRLSYRDENFVDRIGWREVVARAAPGVALGASSVPAQDRSRELSDYPADLLNNPPQVAAADVVFERNPLPTVASVPPMVASLPPTAASLPSMVASARPIVAVRPAPVPEPPAIAAAPKNDPAPPSAPVARTAFESGGRGGSRSPLTDLMTRRDMGPGLLLLTVATALVLGAFHALEPGHGKTVVAAYIVGSRGTAWHAVVLGLAVTASHTAGVFLLGAVTLWASRYVMPDRLYPWLGAISGLAIAGVGLALLRQRWRGAHAHGHDHGHEHLHAHGEATHQLGHDHGPGHSHPHGQTAPQVAHDHGEASPQVAHDHGHADQHTHHGEPHDHAQHHEPGMASDRGPRDHGQDSPHGHHHGGRHHHHHVPAGPTSIRSLVALGLSGGIVPCPGALVVLLSALAWQRVGLGILLVVAFSVGLAAVLVAIGLLMLHARRLLGRRRGDGPLTTRWLPLASSAVIIVLGVMIAVRALAGAEILGFRVG